MRTHLLVAMLAVTACAHKDQVKETLPTSTAPTSTAPTVPTTTTASTPAPTATPSYDPDPSLTPLYFAFDDVALSATDQLVLRQIGEWLLSHKSATLGISGHADERGTVEYNLALGDRRANAAAEYLHRLGVGTERMKTISYGKLRPAVEGHDEASWAKNRRDEFELSPSAKSAGR